MPDIDLHNAYDSTGESVHDLFDKTEEGFFVPLYQREYTWEEDNVNQLFDDLLQGIQELAEPGGDNATTFLGRQFSPTQRIRSKPFKRGSPRRNRRLCSLSSTGSSASRRSRS
jgi:hypothetical protein